MALFGKTIKAKDMEDGQSVAAEVIPEAEEKAVKTKKSKEKKSKNKIVENHGITGAGTDYTVYILSFKEKLLALLVGFAVGFGASVIYFDSKALSIIVGILIAIKAPSIFRGMQQKKRLKELRLQFRDLLESLSNSYTVGMTANRAFHEAYADMVSEHGEGSYIANEVALICSAHDTQGIEIKDMINDFAVRSGLDDVKSFASVFDVSTNLGGDVAKVIRETRDMIGDKIETELEIQTMVTGQKNQLNVLAVMPLVMSFLTRFFGSGTTSIITIIVKIVALALFVFAYWLGTRIVDIKV
ncbi:MAG: kinase [Ruminococcus sp.]|nr:kinase [Ruminococcus sp.]